VDGNFTAWAHDERITRLHWTGKLRGPDFEPIEFRLPTIYTTNLVDAKGRAMPTVMAEVLGETDLLEVEQKAKFQEERVLRAILDRPDGSIADWAKDCGWLYSAKSGEKQMPNKSLAQRVIKRLLELKLIEKDGRSYGLKPKGKKAAEAAPKILSAA
jgi:hypothetical protein